MGISTSNQNASIGDIDIKDVDLSSIETSTHNGNYQDYEEIDYNQPIENEEVNTDPIFDIDEKIDESFEPLKPIEPVDKTDDFEMEEIDVIEELKKMIGIIDYSISQSKQELEDLNGKYALMIDYRGNYYATERDKIKKQIKSVQQEIATLKAYREQIQNTIDLKPYQDIIDSSKYASYKRTYDCDYQKLDYELMAMYSYDTTMYVGELMRRYTTEELEAMHANEIDEFALIEHLLKTKPDHIDNDYAIHMNPFLNQAYEKYKYMTEDEIMLYHYLFQTEGMESANAYLALLDDKINQAKGAALAMEFIHGLDLTDEGKLRDTLANFFGVSGRGLIDGIENFFTGLANVFQNNGTLTADDYEKMIILQYLQENSIYHDEIYEFSSSLGNMVPAMVASAIATIIATPAGGATVAGISFSATEIGAIAASTLMGFSAMGNAKHQALVNGADTLAANVYGIFIGASEALLGYFLGNIPGISQTAGFTLSEILQEGVEEYLQEWIEAGLQAVILGQDVDWSEVPANATKSFFMGVLMSGFLNGGQQIVTVMIDGVPLQIDVEESLKYMEEHNNATIEEALMATSNNGGLLSRIFGTNTQNVRFKRFNTQTITTVNDFFAYFNVGRNNYGVNQGFINELYYYEYNGVRYSERQFAEFRKNNPVNPSLVSKIANTEYQRLKNSLLARGFDRHSASMIMSALDQVGACSYAAICNSIFYWYKDYPNQFKADFGFDMYVINPETGNWMLNSGELLLDLYIYMNSDVNGGSLIFVDSTGMHIRSISQERDAFGRLQMDADNQRYMSGSWGIADVLIDQYLATKGHTFSTQNIVSHFNATPLSDAQMQRVINDVGDYLSRGYAVHLGIRRDANNPIRMISQDPSKYSDVSTTTWNEGGGHAVFVTGITPDGILVSSWGQCYLIPFSDLQNGPFDIRVIQFGNR